MKIMNTSLHSTPQQESANFSKALHVASKAKNPPSVEKAVTTHLTGKILHKKSSKSAVTSTLQEIREKLNRGGLITHSQLQEIAFLINGLSAEQTQQVIEGLTDIELAALAKEMKSGGLGPLTGLSESERCDFIGMLASRLDAKQFQRVAEAFGDPASYAGVVAEQGSNDAKIGFINAFKEEASTTSADLMYQYGYNDSATAIGTVLASMDAEGLNRAIGHWDEKGNYQQDGAALSEEQLKTILAAGLGYKLSLTAFAAPTHDPSILNNILDAVADNGDVRMKAEVFSIVSGIMEGLTGPFVMGDAPQTATAIGDHMYRLLHADTAAIVDYLEDTDPNGTALTNFVHQLWIDGETSEIGTLLAILAKRVPQEVNAINAHDNAQDLGYLLGAIRAGMNDLNADKEERNDLIAGMLSAVASLVPKIGDIVGFTVAEIIRQLESYEDGAGLFLNILTILPDELCTDAEATYSTVVVSQE